MSLFDGALIWWHWHGGVVPQSTPDALAAFVREVTPNATGIAIKTSNGVQWQGEYHDPEPQMAVTGPASISRWVNALAAHDLETHLWCVLHGQDVEGEARRIIEACQVEGVRSMILDVEASERYFGSHPPEVIHRLMGMVRAEIPIDFHLGLCLFVHNDDPEKIHLPEWLPYVQSLHPMVYHWDFSAGKSSPEPYLDSAFDVLKSYQLPIIPILGAYPESTNQRFSPPEHLYQAGMHALKLGASGLSVFRLGDETVLHPDAFAAVRRIPTRR